MEAKKKMRMEERENMYRKAIEESHNLNTQGKTFFELGEFTKAIEQYKLAIELNPNHYVYQNNLAEAYIKSNHFIDAKHRLEIMLRRLPEERHIGNFFVKETPEQIAEAKGRMKTAEDEIDAAVKSGDTHDFLDYERSADLQCEADLRKHEKDYRKDLSYKFVKVVEVTKAHLQNKDLKKAHWWVTASDSCWSNLVYAGDLGNLTPAQVDMPDRIRQTLLVAAQNLHNEGDECFDSGEYKNAENKYERAEELDPGNVIYRNKIAKVRNQLKKYHETRDILNQVLSFDVESNHASATADNIQKAIELNKKAKDAIDAEQGKHTAGAGCFVRYP